jgi:hypothetical protein
MTEFLEANVGETLQTEAEGLLTVFSSCENA